MTTREAVVSARIIILLFASLLAASVGMYFPSGMALGGAGIEVYKYIALRRAR
jgi:hypothetical protein